MGLLILRRIAALALTTSAMGLVACDCSSSNGGPPPPPENNPPVAHAGPDQDVDDGATVTLDGSGSTDADGDTLTYEWTQTAGPTITLDDHGAVTPNFTAPTVAGGTTLELTLTVTDPDGDSDTDAVTVTVTETVVPPPPPPENNPPVAQAGSDQDADGGATATLDASGSSDADGDALTYEWVQSAGPAVTLDDDSAVMPAFTAPSLAGGATLEFTLTVTDPDGAFDTDAVTVTVHDVTAPSATVREPSIGANDDIVIDFTESMAPGTLDVTGPLAGFVATETWSTTTVANDTLTLSPAAGWETGIRELAFEANDTAGNVLMAAEDITIRLILTMFQPAASVIGQADFTGSAPNRGGATAANTLGGVTSQVAVDPASGILYIGDAGNNRVLGFDSIPSANGVAANFVLGQADFIGSVVGTSDSALSYPQSVATAGGKLVVTDSGNNRVSIFDPAPAAGGATIAAVVGQSDKTSSAFACTASGLEGPEYVTVTPGGRLIVGDNVNNRVLVWNALPTADAEPADLVLGQASFTTCARDDDDGDGANNAAPPTARTLDSPTGVWSDDTRLVVQDSANNRVLIWSTFPTTSFQPADLVLGQASFADQTANDDDQDGARDSAPTSRTMDDPYDGVWSNGVQLFVADTANARVMVWNDFPTTSFAPADLVLGHSSFTSRRYNDDDQDGVTDGQPSARTFRNATGVFGYRDRLFVTDTNNSRVLIFRSQ